MGVGRREFVKLMSIALSGVMVDPLQSVITNENLYINKKLGILFYKPKDWTFVSVKDFGRIKDAQIIGTGLEISKEELWEELGDPICIATKYSLDKPEHKGIFSPTITLNITPKEELDDLECESFEQVIGMSEYGVSQLLKEFKVIERHKPYQLSNSQFYEYDAEYLFEHIELSQPVKVELKVLKAEHNGFYYDFNCHQSKEQGQIAEKEFQQFKNTIKLI